MVEFGDIEAKSIAFQSPINPNHCYVVCCDDDSLEWENFKPFIDAKRATGINLDGCEKNFYVNYSAHEGRSLLQPKNHLILQEH